MKKIGRILLTAAVAAVLSFPLLAGGITQTASALNSKEAVCEGLGGSGGDNCSVDDQPTLNTTVRNVINIISVVAGVAAVIMIIVGGFRYVTSQGDSGTTSSAKNTIIYAIIGLVIVAMAQVIVQFVLTKAV